MSNVATREKLGRIHHVSGFYLRWNGISRCYQMVTKEQGQVQSSFSFFSVAMMTVVKHLGNQSIGAGVQATLISAKWQYQ